MQLGLYFQALAAALIVAVTTQMLVVIFIVAFVESGGAALLQTISLHLFNNNVLSGVVAFFLEYIVGFSGIFAAGNIAPGHTKGVCCWIITVICLAVSQILMLPITHHAESDTGWFYLMITNPLLYCFALGGVSSSIYFTLKREEKGVLP